MLIRLPSGQDMAVGESENPGVPVLFCGHNLPPLVEIGLTDLPKNGGAMAPPAPPGTTGLGVASGLAVLRHIRPNPQIQSGSVIYSPDCYLLTRGQSLPLPSCASPILALS